MVGRRILVPDGLGSSPSSPAKDSPDFGRGYRYFTDPVSYAGQDIASERKTVVRWSR